jgi:hypothetical protein
MELVKKLAEIQKVAKTISALLKVYNNLKQDPVANAYKLGEVLSRIEKENHKNPSSELKEEVSAWIKKEVGTVYQAKDEARLSFGKELAEGLKGLGIVLRGQYPDLYAGLYHLKLEFEKGLCKLFWGPEPIKSLKLNSKEIISVLYRHNQSLRNRKFDLEDFYQNLYKAYQRALMSEEKEEGEKVPIVDVLNEFVFLIQTEKFRSDPKRQSFKEYTRIEFGYDLYLFRKKDPWGRLKLSVATFDATKSRLRALFVPDSEEEGTRYAYVALKR